MLLLGSQQKNLVIPTVWKVSRPAHVRTVRARWGQQARLAWCTWHKRVLFAGTWEEVLILLSREAGGKEKEISLPFPPLFCLSQFFSGHLQLQTHCSYLVFVGESMESVSVKVILLPSRL